MTALEEIRDIFAILHDGTISAWTGDRNFLTLTIDCGYLAEQIDKSFDLFYVELVNVDQLFLSTWPNPFDLPVQTLTELNSIFESELEILTAEIKTDKVVITCNQHDTKFDYCGGNLTISCQTIKILDQERKESTIEQLDRISYEYWTKSREK